MILYNVINILNVVLEGEIMLVILIVLIEVEGEEKGVFEVW